MDYKWHSERNGIHYSVEIDGIKLQLWRHEGTKESAGGKYLLARQFLEKEKWQTHVKENFGEKVFSEVLAACQSAQQKFEKNHPKTYGQK